MFADVVGSTSIASALDPEDWRVLLSDCISIVEQQVLRHGGYVAKLLGDGVLCYFGWPRANGNEGVRAVNAALAIQSRILRLNRKRPRPADQELALRIGIHAGTVVVGGDSEIYGDAPHIAARLQEVAEPGAVFVTRVVNRTVANGFRSEHLGSRLFKGVQAPVDIYRVLGKRSEGDSTAAPDLLPLSTFQSRDETLATLLQLAGEARSGKGRALLISGEPGIGKSRLLREFRRRLASDEMIWLEARGDELYAHSPFYGVVDLLSRALQAEGGIPGKPGRQSLVSLLRRARIPAGNLLPTLQSLMEKPAESGTAATIEETGRAIRLELAEGLWALSRQWPTVVVIEDLQWIDPSTIDCLRLLLLQLREFPVLLLLTCRDDKEIDLGPPLRKMKLEPLPAGDIEKLVSALPGASGLTASTIARIAARSAGVPLFAEELAWHLTEQADRSAIDEIPATLANLLIARLDRLGDAKFIAQTAAAIGPEFTADFVAEVSALPTLQVSEALESMVQHGLVSARRSQAPVLYAFHHVLVRDVAYSALLRVDRLALHANIARAIRSPAAPESLRRPEIEAHHLALSEQWKPACEAWYEAGLRASERHSYAEAETAYASAVKALMRLPTSPERNGLEINLLREYLEVMQIVKGYTAPDTMRVADLLQAAMQQAGQDAKRNQLHLVRTWSAVSSLANYADAAILADMALDLARQSGKPDDLAGAHLVQMTTCYRRGRLTEAEAFFRDGEEVFRTDAYNHFPGAVAQTFGTAARLSWILGERQESLERIEFARAQAKRKQSPYDEAFVLYMQAILDVLDDRPAEAERLARQALQLSQQNGFAQFSAISKIVLGRAQAALGSPQEGIVTLRAGLDGLKSTKSRVALTMYLGWLGEIQALAGRPEEAESTLSIALATNPQELFYRPELLRLLGELRQSAGRLQDALVNLQEAARLAAEMRATTYEARIARNLERHSGYR